MVFITGSFQLRNECFFVTAKFCFRYLDVSILFPTTSKYYFACFEIEDPFSHQPDIYLFVWKIYSFGSIMIVKKKLERIFISSSHPLILFVTECLCQRFGLCRSGAVSLRLSRERELGRLLALNKSYIYIEFWTLWYPELWYISQKDKLQN